jgi:hypothetical protein
MISSELVEHVDVVIGGDFALCGSDAVGGVVNFIRDRQDFRLPAGRPRQHGPLLLCGAHLKFQAAILREKERAGVCAPPSFLRRPDVRREIRSFNLPTPTGGE